MTKNKEIRRIIVIEVIVILMGIITIVFANNYTFDKYRKAIISNNANIVNKILEVNPEFEDTVIQAIINNELTYQESLVVLEKYGLDEVSAVDYLGHNRQIRQDIKKMNLMIIIPYLVVIFTIFIVFIKRTYRKIGSLSKYANEILNNRYNMDIREYEEGDISNLKNDLYKMTIKLKEQSELSLRDKEHLAETLSDISHQLKTPLTGMYVINEILYDNNLSQEKRKELLLKNKNQLERIEWLITSLLKMSKLDSDTEILKRNKTKIIEVINKALAPLNIPLELKNIQLIVDCEEGITANIDLYWTSEALLNIIKNASEHTDMGGVISIICTENPIYTEIIIKDTGSGIKEKDLRHIFERFYKGNDNKDSIGIGLNMSKKIIDKQDGEISVSSVLNEGSTFTIKFYKKVI